jgi:uncharacterized membrane protein YbhN (UPF0104 family)/tRNA A-37 threonylcarbamoyl transferase component Bud32
VTRTEDSGTRSVPPGRAGGDSAGAWSLGLLIEWERGRRNRRTADAALLLVAAVSAGLCAVITSSAPSQDAQTGQALMTLLGWADPLWRLVLVGVLALALAVIVDVIARRRWDLARDLIAAVLTLWVISAVLSRAVDADWVPFEPHLFSRWGFPDLRLTLATATLVTVAPELVRGVRILATWLVPLAVFGVIAIGAALPSASLAGLALGLGAGALVRLAFGSAAGVPPSEHVRHGLTALGVELVDLHPAREQRIGAAEYVGHDPSARPVHVRLLGRDAQDTQRLARRWQLLSYRAPLRSMPVARLEQVEHEALATVLASQAGVRVPGVEAVGLTPDGDAVLATSRPDVEPLERAREVSDATLGALCQQVARLHDAGIAHGRLNAANVVVTADGPMLVDFSAATLAAPQSALDVDVAELLVACAVLVGPRRTLDMAVAAGWGPSIARVLPYLQRAALTPHLRDLARSHEVTLKELRAMAAAATGSEAPEPAPLRRVRPKDLLFTGFVVFAAYGLITKLADIGFSTIARELGDADLAWVAVALLLAQCTFIASGISVRGAVATPLPLLPCVVLQSAIKFINITVPSSAGRIGTNLRFLQRMGAPRPEALAAGAVDDVSETLVQAALFVLCLAFVNTTIDTSSFSGGDPDTRLLALIGVALAISAIVVLSVPKLRAKVLPPIRRALAGVWSVARVRRKRLELFGGNVAAELLYALALGAVCHAYGIGLDVAQLVFVNASSSVISSMVPTPGGIGAAEASISAGLISIGVDESTAFAIAVTHRLCTFYLPPIWGYASLRWLTRRGYL